MMKFNDLLDKTTKTVGGIAKLSFAVAGLCIGLCLSKAYFKSFFDIDKKIKGKRVFVVNLGSKDDDEDDDIIDSEEVNEDVVNDKN